MLSQAYAIPSYAATIIAYNDIAMVTIWQWIVYGVSVLGPGAAICNWALPTIYSLLGGAIGIKATLSGDA